MCLYFIIVPGILFLITDAQFCSLGNPCPTVKCNRCCYLVLIVCSYIKEQSLPTIVSVNIVSASVTNNVIIFPLVRVGDKLSNECVLRVTFQNPFQ